MKAIQVFHHPVSLSHLYLSCLFLFFQFFVCPLTCDALGTPVSFLKRAQILAADLSAYFHRTGLGHFTDMDHLTMFADYRVPQMLAHLGAIEYSPALLSLLCRGTTTHTPDTSLLATSSLSCFYLYITVFLIRLPLSSPQFNLHLL